MKAVIADRPYTGKIVEIKEPKVRDAYEVKVKIAYAGISNNDVRVWKGQIKVPRKSKILGHIGSGVIVEVGKMAAEDGWAVGDRVSADSLYSCGLCSNCKSGYKNACLNKQAIPSMAEYVIWDCRMLYKIPEKVSLQEGTLFLPLCYALHVIDIAEIKLGSSALIMGASTTGLLLAQLAMKAGAERVVVVDEQRRRRCLADSLGATHVVGYTKPNTFIHLLQISGGKGFDYVIDAMADSEALEWGSALLAIKGTLIIFAIYEMAKHVSFEVNELLYKEASIKTALNSLNMMPRAERMLPTLKLKPLITGVFPLTEVNTAYQEKALNKHAMVLVEF